MSDMFPTPPGPRESSRLLVVIGTIPDWVQAFSGVNFVIEAQVILRLATKSTIVTTTLGKNNAKVDCFETRDVDGSSQTVIVPSGSIGKAMDTKRFYIGNCIADSRFGKADSLIQLTFGERSVSINRYTSNGYATIIRNGDTYTIRQR